MRPVLSTAILLFSRTAEAEAQHKSFGAGKAGDLRIAKALLRRTQSTLGKLDLPVIRIDETRQRGTTFGERLAGGLSDAFALGYENILVVGNDAPGLLTRHLRSAQKDLAAGNNVLIPDARGGLVLLGIQRKDFDAVDLADLGWETDCLVAGLKEYLPELTTKSAISDINTVSDLRRAWYFLRTRVGELLTVLRGGEFIGETIVEFFASLPTAPSAGRAPPVA